MKILSLHCDYIKFKALKKALKQPEELSKEQEKEHIIKEALVIFTAVEKTDSLALVPKLIENIKDIASQVNCKEIVLYPYAHLSSNLSAPEVAISVLTEAEKLLEKDKKFKVTRAPFGYYKEFELKCKGHPLAELSREIKAEEGSDIPLDAIMETSCHLVYETTRKMLKSDFISISEVKGNTATLNWKGFKNKIDDELIKKIEKEVNKNRESNLPIDIKVTNRADAWKICGSFYDEAVPKDSKDIRVVTISSLPPEPCKYNHVSNTNQIPGKIVINGFEKAGDNYYKIKIEVPAASEIKVEEKYDPKQLLNQISKSKLDTSKLKENDHRILGQKLDLFSFNEVAPGMVFLHNNGLIIYNELIRFWREEHRKAGYIEISTPQILDKRLWQISGHWEKYKENIFLSKYEGREFAVKPMNCPGGILIYKSKPKSYKEFPLRVGELGIVHRQELSGVLAGLFRVIKFTQDDAHIYCTEEQLEEEIIKIIELDDKFYKKFGFSYRVELSTRPEKRIGDEKIWDKTEKILENILKKRKMNFKINKGDGAFYGPKIDFHLTDSLGRTWQCGTIQLDMAMPERFDLTYMDENNKEQRPIMLHRVLYGSLERFMGILLEHTNGKLPTWLSPIQARVISFTDRNIKACENLVKQLQEQGIRADSDMKDETVNNKVRNAEMLHIPYIIVLGDKEEQNKTLAVRARGKKPEFGVKLEKFISDIKREIEERN